ncbi:hypothetical protein Barb4_01772 [Bacteroidales bacterium Barb4]|nr:hypothetical protein Barb4_01772 [Bacteroidales bacterium Barb4]
METETELTATAERIVSPKRPKATQKQIDEAAYLGIPIDEYGVPIGISLDEFINELYDRLSEHYGVDLRTLI